tara:strand:+ start:795 stop:1592 length:798 start_codon:yes stop_codon:yes gene_type:complete
MAFAFDELFVYGGQIIASAKKIVPKALGVGNEKIDHSVYIQGNTQIGKPDAFSDANATLMIGREDTKGTDRSLFIRGNTKLEGDGGTKYTLNVNGDVTIVGNTDQTGNITASGTVKAATLIGSHTSGSISGGVSGKSAGAKAFDIPHPSKEGYRLRHICVEGPESAVYYRGRTNKNIIPLPLYWKDLIDPASLTVTLTPIGAHQNIIVKRWDAENIYLQNQGAMPINCFFHVFAQRIDIERLIPEYEGQSSDDYPGDNSIYSINK